jgi:type II secretory pathway pseudopilin PulG
LHRPASPVRRIDGFRRACAGSARRQAGLTLVEVLLALLVLIVGLVSIMAVFPQVLGSVRNSGRTLSLNQMTAEKLEALRALAYDDGDLAPGVHPAQQTDSGGDRYYPAPGYPETHSLRWTVLPGPTDSSGTAEPSMKTVVVEATYLVRYTGAGVAVPQAGSLQTRFRTFLTERN